MSYAKGELTRDQIPRYILERYAGGLIDAGQRSRTLHELSGLVPDLIKIWDGYGSDPELRLAAEGWRENAGFRSES